MIRNSLSVLILAFCQFGLQAQETEKYTWFNPAESASPVVEGRGWNEPDCQLYNRLPDKAQTEVRTDVWNLSKNTAGEYLNFKTSARAIVVRYKVTGGSSMPHMPTTGVSGIDLYARDVNGAWKWARGQYRFRDTSEYQFRNLALSSREEEFRLYLPLYNTVTWLQIGVPDGATFKFLPKDTEKPIVAYGTSILQGACASRPGLAWTNILGRKLDRSIVNLGFSGNGRLEAKFIDLIAGLDARLYILDCMPNLVRNLHLTDAEIESRIRYAVGKLQQSHPHVPVLLTEHSGGLLKADMDTALVNDYKNTSNILRNTFTALQTEGVKGIYLLTDDAINFDTESMVDGTHPNDIGMMKLADAYEDVIRQILVEPKGDLSICIPVRQRRDNATYDFMERHQAVLKTIHEKQPKLVLIGNSITNFWGGLPESNRKNGPLSWAKYMEPFNPINLGFGWDKIENVLWRVYHGELDGFSAKNILLTIGTNNLSVGATDEDILTGLEFLMEAVQRKQPNAKLFLSGIYPRKNYEKRISNLNQKISLLAKQINVRYVNPGRALLNNQGKIEESLFSDGLHPNEAGYEKLGSIISKVLE